MSNYWENFHFDAQEVKASLEEQTDDLQSQLSDIEDAMCVGQGVMDLEFSR